MKFEEYAKSKNWQKPDENNLMHLKNGVLYEILQTNNFTFLAYGREKPAVAWPEFIIGYREYHNDNPHMEEQRKLTNFYIV